MSKQVRHAGSVWEKHKDIILGYYENHCLGDVMAYMEQEHSFKATRMAFKKKLGRWHAPAKRKRYTLQVQIKQSRPRLEDKTAFRSQKSFPTVIHPPNSYPSPHPTSTDSPVPTHPPALAQTGSSPSSVVESSSSFDLTEKNVYEFISTSLQPHNELEEFEIITGLDLLLDESLTCKNFAIAERILSAYQLFLGPRGLHYLRKSEEYCYATATSFCLSEDVAIRFQQTMSDFRRVGATISSDKLKDDVFVAVSLRFRDHLADDDFRRIISSLVMRYLVTDSDPYFPSLGKAQLYMIQAYFKITSDGWEASKCSFEAIHVRDSMQVLLFVLLRRLKVESPLKTVQPLETELDDTNAEFLHNCMILLQELWQRQCAMQKNWLWQPALVAAILTLDNLLFLTHWRRCAYYRAICYTILIPWYEAQGDESLVHRLTSQLEAIRRFPGLLYQDKINLLMAQHAENLEVARALLAKDSQSSRS